MRAPKTLAYHIKRSVPYNTYTQIARGDTVVAVLFYNGMIMVCECPKVGDTIVTVRRLGEKVGVSTTVNETDSVTRMWDATNWPEDPHRATAALHFGITYEEVTPEQREVGKEINSVASYRSYSSFVAKYGEPE